MYSVIECPIHKHKNAPKENHDRNRQREKENAKRHFSF